MNGGVVPGTDITTFATSSRRDEGAKLTVTVVGGGIIGLSQAVTLAERGHAVTLREMAPAETTGAASRCAGAMLAPYCEAEAAEPFVQQLGLAGLEHWRRIGAGVVWRGSLVVSASRDRGEIERFARMTTGHQTVLAVDIRRLEPALGSRFATGLFYPDEAHLAPREALAGLVTRLRELGADVRFSSPVADPVWMAAAAGELVIDCRGMAARSDIASLRGVRGEMVVVDAPHVCLTRPVRLLHPRFPLYVVPWGQGRYMLGATSIECEHGGEVTLRSAMELLTSACAIHPGFAEARVVELAAGVRPAFPDNAPKIAWWGRCLRVNGAYRHGFLLAPVLAHLVADHLESGTPLPPALVNEEPRPLPASEAAYPRRRPRAGRDSGPRSG